MDINLRDMKIADFFKKVNDNELLQSYFKEYINLNKVLYRFDGNNIVGKRAIEHYFESHKDNYVLSEIENIKVEDIIANPGMVSVKVGREAQVEVFTLPENATNQDYRISIVGQEIVKVTKNTDNPLKKSFSITGLSEGETTIDVISEDNESIVLHILVVVIPGDGSPS